jgi:chemotaxis protein histidine kinase CheA
VNRTDAPVLPGVTFEVERFEWTTDDRLALVGRWFGLRGHRFLRPTLDVDVAGEHRRMLADLEHKPWAAEDGVEWVAEFRWRGEPAHFEGAELTVSPDLAVNLPAPDNSVAQADAPVSSARLPAQPPRTARLETELAAAAAEVERLTAELAELREAHAASEIESSAQVHTLQRERDEARDRLASTEADRDQSRERLAAVEAERNEARERLTEAEVERDQAKERLRTLETDHDEARTRLEAAEAERAAAAEARDEARAERNAWMSRAKAAALPTAPPPQAGRPTSGAAPLPGAPAPQGGRPASDARSPGRPAKGPDAGDLPAATPRPEPAPDAELPATPRAEPARHADDPATEASPAPAPETPPHERRTIRIGERPLPGPPGVVGDPMRAGRGQQLLDRWGPRVAAVATLLVLLAVVALVLTRAL